MTGEYVIGSSSDATFATPTLAAQALSDSGATGTVVFKIEPGTYGGFRVEDFTYAAGTKVVFKTTCSSPAATIQASATALYVSGPELVFENLNFETQGGNVVQIDTQTQAVSFDNCSFTRPETFAGISPADAVFFSESTGEVLVEGCTISGGSFGVYILGQQAEHVRKATVRNCTIEGFSYKGILIEHATRLVVDGNTGGNAFPPSSVVYGMSIQDVVGGYSYITDNEFHLVTNGGHAKVCALEDNRAPFKVKNNIFTTADVDTIRSSDHKGIQVTDCGTYLITLSHNTVITNGKFVNTWTLWLKSSNTLVFNNIFMNTDSGDVFRSYNNTYVGGRNVWYETGGFTANINFQPFSSFGSFSSALGESFSANEDPGLRSDFTPTNASIFGMGTDLQMWEDIYGHYRSTPPTPGAVRGGDCSAIPAQAVTRTTELDNTTDVSLILGKKAEYGRSVSTTGNGYTAVGAPGASWETHFSPHNTRPYVSKFQGGYRVFYPDGIQRDYSISYSPIGGTMSSKKHSKKLGVGTSIDIDTLDPCSDETIIAFGIPRWDDNSRGRTGAGEDDGAVGLRCIESGKTSIISPTRGGFVGQLNKKDNFGWSVAWIGDVNGDGTNDLAVGAIGSDLVDRDAGAVWILFMNPDMTVAEARQIAPAGLGKKDYFGRSVEGIGDDDGDGVPDIAVGAPLDDDGAKDNGAVYIIHLNPDATIKDSRKVVLSIGNRAEFGASIASRDIDNNGVADLLVGTPGADAGAGRILRIFRAADSVLHAEEVTLPFSPVRRDRVGDGCDILENAFAVGAPGMDLPTRDVGAAYVLTQETVGTICADGVPAFRPSIEDSTLSEKHRWEGVPDEGKLLVYPNPAAEGSSVSFRGAKEEVKNGTPISIFNLNGSLVSSQKIENGVLDVSALTPGFYTLAYTSNNEARSSKLIIQ